jgi:hypothetical protein
MTQVAAEATRIQLIERLPVSNFMPPEGVEFRPHAYVPLPAIGASAIVVQFTVPVGDDGMLNRLANEFVGGGFQQGAGGVTWKLFVDFQTAVPAPNFQSIVASLGSVNNPTILNGIRVKENQVVTLQVTNVSIVVAGQQIGGLLGGYYFPLSLEPENLSF